jgi:hypothetical protein
VAGLARIPGLRLGRVRQPVAPAVAVYTDLHVIVRHAGADTIAGRPGDGDAGRLKPARRAYLRLGPRGVDVYGVRGAVAAIA